MITSNFAQILYDKGIKLKDVCEQTGISKDTLSGLFHNKSEEIHFHSLEQICNYLNVPLSDLLEYDPNERNEIH